MAKQAESKPSPKRFDDPTASYDEKLAALGGPVTEPSDAERERRHRVAMDAAAKRARDEREAAVSILSPGTMVRTDVFGWRYEAHRVVSDDGHDNLNIRRVTIEKLAGPRKGERYALRRDRVWLSPGH